MRYLDDDPFSPLPDEISPLPPDLIASLANRYRFMLSMFYLKSRSPWALVYLAALIKIRGQLETAIELNELLRLEAPK